jgi:hypothetical protein
VFVEWVRSTHSTNTADNLRDPGREERVLRKQVGHNPLGGGYQGIEMGALVVVRGIHARANQGDGYIAACSPEGFAI